MEQILRGVQGVTDIQVGREEGLPEYQVRMRQDRAATMGLTTSRVAGVVKTAIEGNESSVYVDPVTGREHIVRVRLAEGDRSKLEDLRRLPIPVTGGKVVRFGKCSGVGSGILSDADRAKISATDCPCDSQYEW